MYTDAASLCIISVYKSGDIPGKTPLVSSLAYYTYVCIMAKHLCVCVCVMHLIRPSKLLFISCSVFWRASQWFFFTLLLLSFFLILMESVFMKCSYLTAANVATFPAKNSSWKLLINIYFAPQEQTIIFKKKHYSRTCFVS